ncbi:MAG: hemerythrin domain-containing protein [Sphingomicrobium sp.]
MARTTIMRAQVDAANAMLDRIRIGMNAYDGDASACPLALDLSRLAGILRIHFSLADRNLYPFLIASGSPETAALAREFQREICTLATRFERFSQRWQSSSLIASNISLFRSEAAVMIMAIRRRLRRETSDLFPIADALAETVDIGWSGMRQAVAG